MKKNILVLLSAIALGALPLTACGGDKSSVVEQQKDPITVAIEQASAKLVVGESLVVTATVEHNDENLPIVWTSSAQSVATVKDGKITAVSAGSATISATVGDASDSIEITVRDQIAISLAAEKEVLIVGETTTVTPTVENNEDNLPGSWESKDPTVATVEDGVVTAVKAGETEISYKIGEISASVSIRVRDQITISLEGPEGALHVGDTHQMVATIANNEDKLPTEWSSETPTVATVSETGLVEAVGIGTSVITAKVGEVTATHTITVEAIPVESITFLQTDATIGVSQSLTLEAKVLPENATDKTWTLSSSDELTVSVDGHTITGLKETAADTPVVITATAGNVTATLKVTVVKLHSVVLPAIQEKLTNSIQVEQTRLVSGSHKVTTTDAAGVEKEHSFYEFEVFDGVVGMKRDLKTSWSHNKDDVTYGIEGDQYITYMKTTDKNGKTSLSYSSKAKDIVDEGATSTQILRSDAEFLSKSVDIMVSGNATRSGIGYTVNNLLTNSTWFGSADAKKNLKYSVVEGVHHLTTIYEDGSFYNEITLDISFDEAGMIKDYTFKKDMFDFADLDTLGKGDLNKTQTIVGSLTSGTRRAKTEHTLQLKDIHFEDYQIEALGGGYYDKHAVTEAAIGESVEIGIKEGSKVPASADVKFDPITIKSIAPADCAKVGYGMNVNLLKATDALTITTVSAVNKIERTVTIKVTLPALESISVSGLKSHMFIGSHTLTPKLHPDGAVADLTGSVTENTAEATITFKSDGTIALNASKAGVAKVRIWDRNNTNIFVEKLVTFHEDTPASRIDILVNGTWGENSSWSENTFDFTQSTAEAGTLKGSYSICIDYTDIKGTFELVEGDVNFTITDTSVDTYKLQGMRYYKLEDPTHLVLTYGDDWDSYSLDVYIK